MVGAGYIAGVHSAGYKSITGTFPTSTPPVVLSRVADADVARAEAMSRSWGWQFAHSDWKEITRADDIDLVDISVPNSLHAEIAIDALAHGKHVVCEKPLAADLKGAAEMTLAAESSGKLAQVCFYYRLWPAIEWARNQIVEGRIGSVIHFRGWMLQDYAADPSKQMGWRTDKGQAGAGALGDLGSHIFDVARYLAGDIVRLSAQTRQTVARGDLASDTDDLVTATVQFESGASGVIEASWAMHGHKCDLGFDIIGDRGAIRFSWERSNEVEISTLDSPFEGFQRVLVGPEFPGVASLIAVAGQGLGYRDAFTMGLGRLIQAISSGERVVSPTFSDGLAACRLVDAALTSSASQSWVDVQH